MKCKYFIVLFRKDFYIEVPDLAKMTDAEVEEYRQEMEGIKVDIFCFSNSSFLNFISLGER